MDCAAETCCACTEKRGEWIFVFPFHKCLGAPVRRYGPEELQAVQGGSPPKLLLYGRRLSRMRGNNMQAPPAGRLLNWWAAPSPTSFISPPFMKNSQFTPGSTTRVTGFYLKYLHFQNEKKNLNCLQNTRACTWNRSWNSSCTQDQNDRWAPALSCLFFFPGFFFSASLPHSSLSAPPYYYLFLRWGFLSRRLIRTIIVIVVIIISSCFFLLLAFSLWELFWWPIM